MTKVQKYRKRLCVLCFFPTNPCRAGYQSCGAPLVLLAQRIFLCVKRQLIVTRHLHNSRARFYYAAKVLCDGSSRWSRPYWVLYPGGMKQRNEIPSEQGKGVGDLCFIRERSDIGTSRSFWPRWTWPRHLPHVLRQRKCLHHPLHGRSKRQPDRGIDLQTAKEREAEQGTSCWLRLVLYRSV